MGRNNMIKVKTWKASNGNLCFCFPMRKIFERPWIIIFAALISIMICGVEFFVWGGYTLLVPMIILLFTVFLWWAGIPLKGNETIIANTVYEIMNKIVDKDAKLVGARVLKKIVNHDTKGTYGIIEASCLLVLLDNEEVWEYPLIYHKSDKHGVYFECEKKYVISENQKHIRKINPKRWRHFINSLKLSEKTSLKLFLILIFVSGGLSFASFCWLIEKLKWSLLLIFVACVGIYFLMGWLYSRFPSKFLNVIRILTSVPFSIIYFLLKAALPFLTIVGTYLFVAVFTFGVSAIIFMGLSSLGWFTFKPATMAFIIFTMGSILCSNSYKTTKWIIHHTPLRDWGNHTYESYQEALAVYLIHPNNVIFLLYFIYFVFLSISGFLQIEGGKDLISKEFDAAIFKAFLVFIAFTNMRMKSKDMEVNTKELFIRTLKLFVRDR